MCSGVCVEPIGCRCFCVICVPLHGEAGRPAMRHTQIPVDRTWFRTEDDLNQLGLCCGLRCCLFRNLPVLRRMNVHEICCLEREVRPTAFDIWAIHAGHPPPTSPKPSGRVLPLHSTTSTIEGTAQMRSKWSPAHPNRIINAARGMIIGH